MSRRHANRRQRRFNQRKDKVSDGDKPRDARYSICSKDLHQHRDLINADQIIISKAREVLDELKERIKKYVKKHPEVKVDLWFKASLLNNIILLMDLIKKKLNKLFYSNFFSKSHRQRRLKLANECKELLRKFANFRLFCRNFRKRCPAPHCRKTKVCVMCYDCEPPKVKDLLNMVNRREDTSTLF